jgi:hypothetical protein
MSFLLIQCDDLGKPAVDGHIPKKDWKIRNNGKGVNPLCQTGTSDIKGVF